MAKKPVIRRAHQTRSSRSSSPYLSILASTLFRGLAKLGPGIVTGASDDDPSGITTYSQVGAQFGFTILWTMLLTFPLMAAIQEINAWIGRVTSRLPGSGSRRADRQRLPASGTHRGIFAEGSHATATWVGIAAPNAWIPLAGL